MKIKTKQNKFWGEYHVLRQPEVKTACCVSLELSNCWLKLRVCYSFLFERHEMTFNSCLAILLEQSLVHHIKVYSKKMEKILVHNYSSIKRRFLNVFEHLPLQEGKTQPKINGSEMNLHESVTAKFHFLSPNHRSHVPKIKFHLFFLRFREIRLFSFLFTAIIMFVNQLNLCCFILFFSYSSGWRDSASRSVTRSFSFQVFPRDKQLPVTWCCRSKVHFMGVGNEGSRKFYFFFPWRNLKKG